MHLGGLRIELEFTDRYEQTREVGPVTLKRVLNQNWKDIAGTLGRYNGL